MTLEHQEGKTVYSQEIFNAVSPLREAAAYEALWDKFNANVKTIAEVVKEHKNKLLSQLISSDLIDACFQQLKEIITSKHKKFEISFKDEADYPKKLLDAKYSIPLLYYMGVWDLIFSPFIAVVGTRTPTPEGIKRTQKLVKSLVEDNYSIVSGLADGIDTIAHKTAIECKGRTIAVIGTSTNDSYPKKNSKLRSEIAFKHLLISQVPLIPKIHHQLFSLPTVLQNS
jgi:DNA processing protein